MKKIDPNEPMKVVLTAPREVLDVVAGAMKEMFEVKEVKIRDLSKKKSVLRASVPQKYAHAAAMILHTSLGEAGEVETRVEGYK